MRTGSFRSSFRSASLSAWSHTGDGDACKRQTVIHMVYALAIANTFPVIHMAASYATVRGISSPVLQTNVNYVASSRTTPQFNLLLLILASFPFEFALAMGGVLLSLRSGTGMSSRAYLLVLVTTFLLFTVVTKGQLPVHGGGPARILLPYIVLLLPYAGFLLTRLLRAFGVGRAQFAVVGGCLLLLIMGTFDILRVFNYPARGFDTDAFYAGRDPARSSGYRKAAGR